MVEAIAKASIGLKFVKIQENQTRIYDSCENTKSINRVRRYIDYRVEDALGEMDINLIRFNKRVYNQYKYTAILICKIIKVRQIYTFTHKGDAKNYIKKFNKIT